MQLELGTQISQNLAQKLNCNDLSIFGHKDFQTYLQESLNLIAIIHKLGDNEIKEISAKVQCDQCQSEATTIVADVNQLKQQILDL